MIHVAVLDPELAAAIRTEQAARDATARDLDVVWAGERWQALLEAELVTPPDVVIVDRTQLPSEVTAALQAIRQRLGARTLITTYGFAPAREIEALRRAGSDVVVQGPLSVRTLRTLLLSMIIERRMQGTATSNSATVDKKTQASTQTSTQASTQTSTQTSSSSSAALPSRRSAAPMPPSTPPPGKSVEDGPVVAARFSRKTLLALRDMSTTIQCECPNHVAELVDRLLSFEAYSKTCENRDDADAAVHRALWFASARARRIMEDALDLLLQHERLTIVDGSLLRSAPAPA